jgi:hypothetical protein
VKHNKVFPAERLHNTVANHGGLVWVAQRVTGEGESKALQPGVFTQLWKAIDNKTHEEFAGATYVVFGQAKLEVSWCRVHCPPGMKPVEPSFCTIRATLLPGDAAAKPNASDNDTLHPETMMLPTKRGWTGPLVHIDGCSDGLHGKIKNNTHTCKKIVASRTMKTFVCSGLHCREAMLAHVTATRRRQLMEPQLVRGYDTARAQYEQLKSEAEAQLLKWRHWQVPEVVEWYSSIPFRFY